MSRPYVAICVPSSGTWKSKMGTDLACLCCYSLRYADVSVLNHETSSIGDCRNRLAQKAKEQEADYVLFIDSDMVFPPEGLIRLLEHDKDIVCATYNRRSPPYDTLGVWEPFSFDRVGKLGLAKASRVPTGFMLIKTDVFRRIEPPWFFETFNPEQRHDGSPFGHGSDDYNFCIKAEQHGYEMFIDFDLTFELGHIGEQVIVCSRPKGVVGVAA